MAPDGFETHSIIEAQKLILYNVVAGMCSTLPFTTYNLCER
jgi:hypothetical protein